MALRVGQLALNLVAGVLVSRTLGPERFGAVALVFALVTITTSIGHLSLSHADAYLFRRGVPLPVLWGNAAGAGGLLGVLSAIVVFGLDRSVDGAILGDIPESLILLGLSTAPFVLQLNLWANQLELSDRVLSAARARFFGAALRTSAVALFVAAGALTSLWAVASLWLLTGGAWAYCLAASRRHRLASFSVSLPVFARAASFGLRIHAAQVAFFLLLRADQFLVERQLGLEAVGLYALAVLLAEPIWFLAESIAVAVLPRLVRSSSADAKELALKAARLSVLVAGILAAAVWLAAPFAIALVFGSAFEGAVWALRVLLPGVVALAGLRPLVSLLSVEGRPVLVSMLCMAAFAANVVGNLVLISVIGLVGASLASTLAYAFLLGSVSAALGLRSWPALIPRVSDLQELARSMHVVLRPGMRLNLVSEQGAVRMRCPLCGAKEFTVVDSTSSRKIWRHLRAVTGRQITREMMRRYTASSTVSVRRCGRCALEYFSPAVLADPAFYAGLGAVDDYCERTRWEFTVVKAKLRPDDRVLDIGCGDGAFLHGVKGHVRSAVGVDWNADSIVRARQTGVTAEVADLDSIDARFAHAFDVVCAFQVLEHLEDPNVLVRSAVDCLAPGGRLFISVPNRRRFRYAPFSALDWPPHHFTRWDVQPLCELATRHGLNIVTIQAEGIGHGPRYLLMRRLFAVLQGLLGPRLGNALLRRGQRLGRRVTGISDEARSERTTPSVQLPTDPGAAEDIREAFGHSLLVELERRSTDTRGAAP